MRKIINKAVYNTATSKFIGSWEPNGYDRSNFSYFAETLYRTKSGKYFVHGEGHANSRYGVWHGNTGGWGEAIRPMSPGEAAEWAEEHLTADEYAAEFGEPEEAGDSREALNTSVSAETKRKLEKLRSETGKSVSQLIDEMASNI
mgnify:CR=1 FL=1